MNNREGPGREATDPGATPGQREGEKVPVRDANDYLSYTSHLTRTPLSGVIGMTELLLGTDLDPRQRMYAEIALRSGERLLRIVEDVLDYSNLESESTRLEPVNFELRPVLKKAATPFVNLAADKGLFLNYSVGNDVPDALRGDAERICQVLSNLLRDAVDRSGEGEVYMRAVLLEDSDAAAKVRFEVIDTAPGLSPERRAEMFSRPHLPLGESIATGMELAISRRLVDLMGGEIGADSEPEEGNVFWVELLLEKQVDPPDFYPAPRSDLRGVRALLVGGDPTSRELLREQADSWEMLARHVEDGPGALTILRETAAGGEPFDMVVLDAEPRDEQILELKREIKADPALAGTRLVLLSSASRDDLDWRGEHADLAALLTKPVPQARLYRSLAAVMGSCPEAPKPPEEPPHRGSEEGGERSLARLLVVDDDSVHRVLVTRMLEMLGYAFDVAVDGREAVEALSSSSYSVVLMDVRMPEMDGYEATAEIRRREGGMRRTPIVALTANAMQGDRKKTIEAGMDDYLSKPVKLAQLERMLARWSVRPEKV